jgi:hypothetical protein
MKLLSRGLTKVTASISLSIIVIITSILTWTLITSAIPNINYTIIQQLPKIESVMYNEQNNELIIIIRTDSYNAKQYKLMIYKSDGKTLNEVPLNIVTTETQCTGLIMITAKPYEKLVNNEYILKLLINDKTLKEYVFRL